MAKLKVLAKISLTLFAGLLLNEFAGPRWSARNESIAAMALVMTVCFLAALSLGGTIRGPGALPAVIAFALSFLVWPVLKHGLSVLMVAMVAYLGILEVLPAIAGGLAGLALRRFNLPIWWSVATAILAVSLIPIGPSR